MKFDQDILSDVRILDSAFLRSSKSVAMSLFASIDSESSEAATDGRHSHSQLACRRRVRMKASSVQPSSVAAPYAWGSPWENVEKKTLDCRS